MRRVVMLLASVIVAAVGFTPGSQARTQPAAPVSCPTAGVETGGNPSALVSADNNFGFKLFARMFAINSGKNVIISPASAALALDMLYGGAAGSSQGEMATALGIGGMSRQLVRSRAAGLLGSLQTADPRVTLQIANAVWARAGVQFKQAFLTQAQRYYGAKVSTLDFSSPQAPKTINAWASCATHGNIPSIADRIAASVVMYVTNATYFHGIWTTAFDPKRTANGPFTTASSQQVQVPFMHLDGVSVPYYQGPDFQLVSLPYGSGRFRMLIALPKAGTSLQSLASRLTFPIWRSWVSNLHPAPIPLALPRFTLKNNWNLNAPLASLGMKTAIGPHSSFTGICTRCKLTTVKQKTYLSVDEKGTTAAAVTTGTVKVTAIGVEMVVDHPFIVAIRDSRTGAVLFVGAVHNPAG